MQKQKNMKSELNKQPPKPHKDQLKKKFKIIFEIAPTKDILINNFWLSSMIMSNELAELIEIASKLQTCKLIMLDASIYLDPQIKFTIGADNIFKNKIEKIENEIVIKKSL